MRHILAFADRDGVASLTRLLDSLYVTFGSSSPEDFFTTAEQALRTCRKLGYLYLDRAANGDRTTFTVSEWTTLALRDLVWWDPMHRRWTIVAHGLAVDELLVQLTHGAMQDLAMSELQG